MGSGALKADVPRGCLRLFYRTCLNFSSIIPIMAGGDSDERDKDRKRGKEADKHRSKDDTQHRSSADRRSRSPTPTRASQRHDKERAPSHQSFDYQPYDTRLANARNLYESSRGSGYQSSQYTAAPAPQTYYTPPYTQGYPGEPSMGPSGAFSSQEPPVQYSTRGQGAVDPNASMIPYGSTTGRASDPPFITRPQIFSPDELAEQNPQGGYVCPCGVSQFSRGCTCSSQYGGR